MFAKIGLAITFSPTGKALLKEAVRLQKLFDSQLVLIHVGEKNSETEKLLDETIENAGIYKNQLETIWEQGDPANTIINCSKDAKIDLLVAGALEKESLVKYYRDSISRKIMRELQTSSLILKNPSEQPVSFKKFCVSADYSPQCEKTISAAFHFALKENAEEFVIIKNFYVPGITLTIQEGGSPKEIDSMIEQLKNEEEEKMKLFVNELNLQGLDIKIVCIYGKEGWEDSNYARTNASDIFAVTSPEKKMRFLDRLFPHEIEYSFETLPTNLLIIK
ncbi:MAG: universal stress protein [Ignavibacteriaceae bacterium]|jgi:nucleotide-binding universal stress UspA family protein|nr:universal stress protein [Ignavibacteriaceae bacterium]